MLVGKLIMENKKISRYTIMLLLSSVTGIITLWYILLIDISTPNFLGLERGNVLGITFLLAANVLVKTTEKNRFTPIAMFTGLLMFLLLFTGLYSLATFCFIIMVATSGIVLPVPLFIVLICATVLLVLEFSAILKPWPVKKEQATRP